MAGLANANARAQAYNASTTDTTPVTATFAGGYTAVAGDLLVAIVGASSGTRVPKGSGGTGTPGGMTLLKTMTVNNNGNKAYYVYAKVAAGGETGVSVYADSSTALQQAVTIHSIGASGTDPAGFVAGNYTATHIPNNTGSGSTSVASLLSPAIDPTETGQVHFMAACLFAVTTTTAHAFTASFTDLRFNTRHVSAYLDVTNPASTSTTCSWTTSTTAIHALVAVPASTPATPAPSAVAAPATLPAPTITTSATPAPAALTVSASMPNMEAEVTATPTPSVVSVTASLPTATPTYPSTVTPSTISSAAVISATATAGRLPTFEGPTEERPFSGALYRWDWERGRTVYRKDGVWVEGTDFSWSTLRDADLVAVADRPGGERTDGTDRDRYLFLGGRKYTISDAVATALTAAGYGSYVEES